MQSLLKILIAVLTVVAAANAALAQQREINDEFRLETINAVLRLLKDKYAYPEIAQKMQTAIREKLERGEYDSISDGDKLAAKITADLRSVFDDKHLKLSFSAQPIPVNSGKAGAPSAEEIEGARRRQRRENFGLAKVEILKGNVGLIQLNYFAPLDWASEALAAAMNVVADADALIFDVRNNTGSYDIDTVPSVCSYLFDKPVQISDILSRETNETRQLWTYAKVPGRKFLDKPVFILTSRKAASGAEAFVSGLKRLKRAALVGEATMGATMPGMSHRVNEHFSIWISTGRAASGSAEKENRGISPDVSVEPEKALNAAYLQALNQILQTTADEEWKIKLKNIAAEIGGKK